MQTPPAPSAVEECECNTTARASASLDNMMMWGFDMRAGGKAMKLTAAAGERYCVPWVGNVLQRRVWQAGTHSTQTIRGIPQVG
jgi:hypothetical protein